LDALNLPLAVRAHSLLPENPPVPRKGVVIPPASHDPAAPQHELDDNPRYRVLPDFHSRFLADNRNILVYLPEAYLTAPRRRFPVFYLQDGQNLFDDRTSYIPGTTWQAHTTADRLTRAGLIEPVILVGVSNTGLRRMAEYTPTRDPRRANSNAGGEGYLYGKLLVEDLKPLIDRTFRTLTGPADIALGGSSLGALISLALGLEYPTVFGKLAIMSPSVWWDRSSILRLVGETKPRPALRIWMDMGTAEGLRHLRDADLLHSRLIAQGWRESGPTPDLRYLRVPGGLHSESAWAARFDQVLEFLFPSKA
jgi:predicted alpha/beta superfamily hydrolase